MGKPRSRWTPALGEAPATGQLRPPSSRRDLGTPAQSAPLHAGLLGLAGPTLSFCWCGPAPGTRTWRTSCSLSQRDFQACWQSRRPRPPLPDRMPQPRVARAALLAAARPLPRWLGRCEAPVHTGSAALWVLLGLRGCPGRLSAFAQSHCDHAPRGLPVGLWCPTLETRWPREGSRSPSPTSRLCGHCRCHLGPRTCTGCCPEITDQRPRALERRQRTDVSRRLWPRTASGGRQRMGPPALSGHWAAGTARPAPRGRRCLARPRQLLLHTAFPAATRLQRGWVSVLGVPSGCSPLSAGWTSAAVEDSAPAWASSRRGAPLVACASARA